MAANRGTFFNDAKRQCAKPLSQNHAGAVISAAKKLTGDVTGVLVPDFRVMKKIIKWW